MDPNAEEGSDPENWGGKNGVPRRDHRLRKDGLWTQIEYLAIRRK